VTSQTIRSTPRRRSWGARVRAWTSLVAVSFVAALTLPLSEAATAGAATAPSLVVSPAGPYRNGQTITVSVGPNRYFKPYVRIVILECALTKGQLPIDDSTCDGNTVQADSLIPTKNGSFSDRGYTLYRLPNETLGEPANAQPVCDQTHPCVLYVGQDQNNFKTWPKVFSGPITIGRSTKR
jgi:hypothetical protein